MARREGTVAGPARGRVGLPIVPDGSRRHPLLLRLPTAPGDDAAAEGACNNGCRPCVTRPVVDDGGAFAVDVAGRHVVIRHREATLRRDLAGHVRDLVARGAASVALVSNGRLLLYPARARELARAGLTRIIVKLFGLDAAAHDAHTRVDGSFDQAARGVAAARAAGDVEVVIAFVDPAPDGDDGAAVDAATRAARRDARVALARRLTDRDPVELPEPEVLGHANEYRYDVVVLRDGITHVHPAWTTSFFPMVHLNTGPMCNVRCVYCNVHGGTDARLYAVDYVTRLLDDAAARILRGPDRRGRPTIDLIGGEPTMHPELPRLIRLARDRGFDQVFICTNGVRLARPGYLDELLDAGLTGVRLSFHDHRGDVAAALADVPTLGSTYPDVAAMLLRRPEVHTHFFRIMLASNLDALPDYLRWLAAHNHTGRPIDLTLGMASMRGRLFDHPEVYPRLDQLRPAVDAAIALATELGIDPLIHHAPACLYLGDATRVAATHVTTTQIDAVRGTQVVMNFEGDARHGAACARCPARDEGCAGLPGAYFDADPAAAEAWLTPITFPAARHGGSG
ncbi:MAG: radical SAM protein [Kofleriaceae bacterium]|nr:radical SAM protein [Kofleriaceae bacterium]